MRDTSKSQALFARAQAIMPGGVSSPVRSFRSVGGSPLIASHSAGSRIWDVDGNEYLDFVMSYGPLLLGHAPKQVVDAIAQAASLGTTFGVTAPGEVAFCESIARLVPSVEKVRLVSSGTEAVMSAVRVARGFTGRSKVVKFEGCYHGHSDGLLAKAGSGVATFDLPDSAGVPAALTAETLTLPYNDIATFRAAMEAHRGEVACVLVEPIAGKMGVVMPKPGCLEALRELTDRDGAVLIFDEVISGFIVSLGGAQQLLGITPDMTTLGKIIGGGLPLAAYGGRTEIMDIVAPTGPVYQAGTLSGNPVAVAAGLAVLDEIEKRPDIYKELDQKRHHLQSAIAEAATKRRIPHTINGIGSLLTVFFTEGPVIDFASAKSSDTARYGRVFRAALELGVCLAPSQFEAAFVSLAHSDSDIEQAAKVFESALTAI